MKRALVSWLMRLYPGAWRAEYGAELADMLRARPLTARVCGDIVLSALWQRLRAIQAPAWVGIILMFSTIAAIASNIVAPPHYGPSALPEYIEFLQKPMRSELYVLVIAGLGFWTVVRGNQRPSRAVIIASLISSLPLMVVGLLMLSGLLPYTELMPGQIPTTFEERGLLYTFYKGVQQIPGPAPLSLVLAPLLRLPSACLWGVIGGGLGRKYANWRRRPASA
jgi:hypothetical protein